MPNKIINVECHATSLSAYWQDNSSAQFDYLWLRDNCQSAFHTKTKERNFDLLSVSENIFPLKVILLQDSLQIEWSEHNHISTYSFQWLWQQAHNSPTDFLQMPKPQTWQKDITLQQFTYEQIVNSDSALYDWMLYVCEYGISIINNCPTEDYLVLNFANKIGFARQTNFGLSFEVKSKPNPNNLAYTSSALPLHTDLPNQELPPGYQLLHCLKNSSTGGESMFVDGFKVAQEFKRNFPEYFELLSQNKIPFRFHDNTCDIRRLQPIISVINNEIDEVIFNAHIATTFIFPKDLMRDFYIAYRAFIKAINNPDYTIHCKLKSDQMAVFDNRRILHGRNSFDIASGERHLQGCYIDRTEFKSKYLMLKKLLKS